MDKRDGLSGVDLVLFDEIREVRSDVKGIDRRLAKMEVKSGIIGALAGTLIFAVTKLKMFFGGA